MAERSEIGIVGGGLLGLTLALRLSRAGFRVTVIEAAPEIGGLAGSSEIGGYIWDRFYHVVLLSDTETRALIEEVGLGGELSWRPTRTDFFVDGRHYPMSSTLDFLRFPPLSIVGKARLAATILRASRITNGIALEGVTAEEWLRRWSGPETLDRIWRPLLRAKLGENYRKASAAFIWATIARMYAARRSGLKREMLGYVNGGYAAVLKALRSKIEKEGIRLVSASPVASVRPLSEGVQIETAAGETMEFDDVVLTLSCRRIPGVCPTLTPAEVERLGRVSYQGIVCASLLFRKPLGDSYVTNITDAWVPFTGVIEMTALVDTARFGGNSLVYLPRYLSQDDAFWKVTDSDVREQFLSALERMYPAFDRADIIDFKVARARDVMAISTLNYSRDALPPVTTSMEHVYIVNSAQIANGTLNVNETVGLANAKVNTLLPMLRRRRSVVAA